MKKVLIADDSHTIVKILTCYLEDFFGKNEVEIISADDGADALFALKEHTFDLFFLDIMMPVVDGHAVAKYVHSRKLELPTIVITSSLDKKLIAELGKIGFKNYLPKPIDNDRMIINLEKLGFESVAPTQ